MTPYDVSLSREKLTYKTLSPDTTLLCERANLICTMPNKQGQKRKKSGKQEHGDKRQRVSFSFLEGEGRVPYVFLIQDFKIVPTLVDLLCQILKSTSVGTAGNMM